MPQSAASAGLSVPTGTRLPGVPCKCPLGHRQRGVVADRAFSAAWPLPSGAVPAVLGLGGPRRAPPRLRDRLRGRGSAAGSRHTACRAARPWPAPRGGPGVPSRSRGPRARPGPLPAPLSTHGTRECPGESPVPPPRRSYSRRSGWLSGCPEEPGWKADGGQQGIRSELAVLGASHCLTWTQAQRPAGRRKVSRRQTGPQADPHCRPWDRNEARSWVWGGVLALPVWSRVGSMEGSRANPRKACTCRSALEPSGVVATELAHQSSVLVGLAPTPVPRLPAATPSAPSTMSAFPSERCPRDSQQALPCKVLWFSIFPALGGRTGSSTQSPCAGLRLGRQFPKAHG